jgi:hypothetical protein
MRQSFVFQIDAGVNGVTGAQTSTLPIFGKGMWHLRIVINYLFVGTVNHLARDTVKLTKIDGTTNLVFIWVTARDAASINKEQTIDMWIALPEDGSRLFMDTAAGVAGDVSTFSTFLLANKLF